MNIFNTIRAALFTKRCSLCGAVIELDDSLCDECKAAPRITGELCKSCGCSKTSCTCKRNKNEYKQIVAPFYYENSIVKSIHSFKDNDMTFLADYLASQMTSVVRERYKDISFDFVTYVPIDEMKIRIRGFNQSQLLAERVAGELSIDCTEVLYKCRRTGTLHKNKSGVKRTVAVFGAFDIYEDCREELNGRTILIVDDVKTTGATLNECVKMLKIYGAREVYAVTAAIKRRTSPDDKNNIDDSNDR